MRSEDRGWDECVGPVLSNVLDLAPHDAVANVAAFLGGLQKTIASWAPMVAKFVNGNDQMKLGVWMAAITELERYCLQESRSAMAPYFGYALQFIWENDVITNEAMEKVR